MRYAAVVLVAILCSGCAVSLKGFGAEIAFSALDGIADRDSAASSPDGVARIFRRSCPVESEGAGG